MYRFFFEPNDRQGDGVRIAGDDAKHIANVLRLRDGDEIILLDGGSMEHAARITSATGREVCACIYETRENTAEPKQKITLYQGLPKGNKLETVIQKCVELGISEIIPMITSRCVARPDEFCKKHARYNRIAYEAAKQARRGIIPNVGQLTDITNCAFSRHELIIFAYEDEAETTLKQAIRGKSVTDAALIIGPEGGFDRDEAAFLRERGAIPVTLGPRILRTETAGMAVLSMIIYEWES